MEQGSLEKSLGQEMLHINNRRRILYAGAKVRRLEQLEGCKYGNELGW